MVKYCSNCGTQISNQDKFCTKCGASLQQTTQPDQLVYRQDYNPMINPKKHSSFGVAALVLGIIGVVMSGIIILYFVGIILGILAIIFGVIGYWGQSKDKYGLAGFICGLVAVILAIIWIIFIFYSRPYYIF